MLGSSLEEMMAEIRKKYNTKFPREVIEEAHRLFKAVSERMLI
jgi:hypothetical protein